MKHTLITAASIALLAATQVETYPIRLSSPSHPGETSRVSFTVARTFSQTWTGPGTKRPPVREAFTATLDADETVDAVSANGRPTKLTYRVARCSRDGVQVLPAGTTVVVETINGRSTSKVNGADPAPDAAKVLRELLYTARPDEPTADEEFGTDQPRKVGDVWPANPERLAKATHLPFRVVADDFTGQAKLVDVSVVDGKPTETVLLTQQCQFDARPVQNGKTYKNLKMTRDVTVRCPLDGTPPHAGAATSTFKVHYTVVGPDGTEEIAGSDAIERN